MTSSKEITRCPMDAIKEQLKTAFNDRIANKPIRIHLDQPFNLYLVEEQAKLYLDAIKDDLFSRQLYKPFLKALDKNIGRIFNRVPNKVDFIDLGPGYPDKSAPLVRHLLKSSTNVRYIPVDISNYFLDSKPIGSELLKMGLLTNNDFSIPKLIGVNDFAKM